MSLNIYSFENIPKFNKPIFILGSFESFHIGHYKLLEKAKELSQDKRDIVLLYFKDVENLPKMYSGIFTDYETRIQNFANLKIQNAIEIEYLTNSKKSPKDFILELTKNQSDFDFVCGSDFSFGYKGQGKPETLLKEYNNKVHVVDIFKLNNNIKISTTYLKQLLQLGEIDLVNTLNSWTYGFNAKLIKDLDNNSFSVEPKNKFLIKLLPAFYIAKIEINSYQYYSVIQIENDTWPIQFIDFEATNLQSQDVKIFIIDKINFEIRKSNEITEEIIKKAKEKFLA
ncbi:FAD synthase [Mycoplasma sp. Mirounga ES2805-ORL]|uniref:FAD synthase n=1 Tax=Mycoplasma sp. Mirounga ES2805-ORL TaxID=754514 RepID=UPI00197C4431|nr:riboflavin biosynthesis protein [Mycoplasma sp. Mirounga ES2805-ORL]QSF13690.1 riboflavin biosynthesis protein [Mycoplasma sp. Mirounga ES2805-ORL]